MSLAFQHAVAKNVTQQDIDMIFSSVDSQIYVDFSALLSENGFSTTLSHITFHANWSQNTVIDFSGCHFESVLFTGNILNSKLTGDFSNCLFSDVNLQSCYFDHCSFDHCIFSNSTFSRVIINETEISQNWFIYNDMNQVYFRNNDISQTIFSDNSLKEVISNGNFAMQVGLINTDLTFSFQHNVVDIQQEQPTIGIVGVSQWHAPAVKALQYFNAKTATIDPYYLPELLEAKLEKEVKKALHDYYHLSYDTDFSAAQYILNSGYESISELNKIAQWYVERIDGLWIPGVVYDIHPEFYGKSASYYTETASTYTREIFEFALIQETIKQEKPIFGVCHGSQMINVYFGGDLFQNVPNQFADQNLKVVTSVGPIGEAIEDGFIGISMHHQAIHHLGEGLELVALYQDVVKACQASDGSPIFLTQFHPEYLPDSSNAQIICYFVQAAAQSHAHTSALELGDILQVDMPFMQFADLKFKEGQFKYEYDFNANWPQESTFVPFEQKAALMETSLCFPHEYSI